MFNFKRKYIVFLSLLFISLIVYTYNLLDSVSKNSIQDKRQDARTKKYERSIAPTLKDFANKIIKKKITENICVYDELQSMDFKDIDGGVWKQGYDINVNNGMWAPPKEPLSVFVVPHSHNDPGWIMTYEEYYKRQTRGILNSAISSLLKFSKLKFIYAEISFFIMFWQESSSEMKENIKRLVKSGRLEIVTGGWVMNDEANTHYYAMIDQMIEGNQWLYDNLGVKPESGWAIDPFGHSATMAYLLGKSGINNILLQRVHYIVKKNLSLKKQLEFNWRQTWDDGSSHSDVFTHMMPFYSYDIPHTCGPEPAVCCQFDFMRLPGQHYSCPWQVNPVAINQDNVEERAKMLLDQYRKKSTLYRTNNVLIPLGDDFRYQTKEEFDIQVQNYELLFDYMNSHPELGVKIQWSTLTDYFKAARNWADKQHLEVPPESQYTDDSYPESLLSSFPTLQGDFFTYSDRSNHYWSGYYTSRPFYKRLSRVVEHRLRAAELLLSQKSIINSASSPELTGFLTEARRHLALFQHHDGITGTAKDFVVVDYGKKLLSTINLSDKIISTCTGILLNLNQQNIIIPVLSMDESRNNHDSLPQRKLIQLPEESPSKYVVVYNSLSHSTERLVTFSVAHTDAVVYDLGIDKDSVAVLLPCQIEPDLYSTDTKYNIVFLAKIPAVGFKIFRLERDSSKDNKVKIQVSENNNKQYQDFSTSALTSDGDSFIENKNIKVQFSNLNGFIKSVARNGETLDLNIDFRMYSSRRSEEMSGAYLFLPQGKSQVIKDKAVYTVLRGPIRELVITEISVTKHQYSLHNTHSIEGSSINILNTVDMTKHNNQELSMHLTSNIDNKDNEFFTDLNAFQIHKHRYLSKLTLQGNFYPTTSSIYIESDRYRLTLLTGQSLGASSQTTGEVEIMQDRRLNQDDSLGLGQGVTDNKVTPNHFRVLVESIEHKTPDSDVVYGKLSTTSLLSYNELIHPLISMISLSKLDSNTYKKHFSTLSGDLPCNMHLLNLKITSPSNSMSTALLLHKQGTDDRFSVPQVCQNLQTTDIHSMFALMSVDKLQETSLTFLHDKEETASGQFSSLDNMQIHTFKMKLSPKSI